MTCISCISLTNIACLCNNPPCFFRTLSLTHQAPIFSGKIQPNVSTDAIKGAALAGAALPILAGAKGAGLSLAALSALSSSYLAVTQGYGGDAARIVGELAWKSTSTLKSVGNATKFLLSAAVNNAKEKSREQMLEAVAKGDSVAAAKLDKDVQKVLAEAEEAVAAAELAAGKPPQPAKAEELARLQDEELLAKGESVCVLFPCCYIGTQINPMHAHF